uniref:Uncharacterized protein n=1 Tax=Globisporangium ultimum (strain ATCC 200006 / CBS 805.95 / DAOM BR144) TaxID=431595 RepID=K3WQ40_GLOUD
MMAGDHDVLNTSLPILDHDDVQSLFPMLSGDSSFEYEGDQQLVGSGHPEFPFESDLSPILAAKAEPVERLQPSSAADSSSGPKAASTPRKTTTTAQSPRSIMTRTATPTATSTTTITMNAARRPTSAVTTSAARKPRKALTPVNMSAKTPEPQTASHSFLTPVRIEQPRVSMLHHNHSTGTVKRRRPSKSEPLSTTWTEHEQNAFFSTFKNKWPSVDKDSSFSTLLLQRFDAISKKIKTKNVIEVRLFYTIVLSNITGLLKELENDIDLTNPDEVRIAVWCWSKLLTDDSHKKDFQNVAAADPAIKKRLSHVLLQSIIRSRRQMLKAKSLANFTYNSAPSYLAMKHAEQHLARAREAPAPRPSVFSLSGPAPSVAHSTAATQSVGAAEKVVVHHPMQSAAVDGSNAFTMHAPKRKRVESLSDAGVGSTVVDETPSKAKRQHVELFVSPAPTSGFSQQLHREHLYSQTPQPQSSKKKMYIKMRIVPMDSVTKAHVASSGCNPKVELKLTSTKKISEVAQHMAKKWKHVQELVPANARLHFYDKQRDATLQEEADASTSSWSAYDRSVTCLDIWKRCGTQLKNENVVVVYYAWSTETPSWVLEKQHESESLMRSPESLFAEEISLADLGEDSSAGSSSSSSSRAKSRSKGRSVSPSPARGLQQFGESMAFYGVCEDKKRSDAATCPLAALLDENDDDNFVDCSPNTQRLRRRITPMLVAKEEFDL